jgi:hypothetical protein
MSSIEEMVGATLERAGHSELKETWLKICETYNEGGPELLETNYSEKIKEIRSKFVKELKQIQSEKPMVRSKKKKSTRRRR